MNVDVNFVDLLPMMMMMMMTTLAVVVVVAAAVKAHMYEPSS
jgi:hypothetical protein